MSKKQPAWERQTGEPILWFTRFDAYRRQGPSRSMLAVYTQERAEQGKQPTGSVPASWRTRSKEWHWKSRADAWDRQMIAERKAEDERMRAEQLEKVRELRSTTIRGLQMLLAKTVGKKNYTPDERGLKELSQAAAIIFKESRLEFGEPTSINRLEVDDWRSQAIEDIKAGVIAFDALAEALDVDLATDLFQQAGVPVEVDS